MKNKIKILFAIDRMSIGGAPAVVLAQLREIDKGQFDPYLLTLYKSKQANYWDAVREILPNDKILECTLKNRSLLDITTWRQVYQFIKKEKFDVVYTHLFLANVLVRLVAIIARVRVILAMEHSFYYEKKIWQKLVDHVWSWGTDTIITPNAEIADFTAAQEHVKRSKFFCIPNPILVPAREDVDIEEMKRFAGIPEGMPVIVNIGRFSEEKGQNHILDIAEELQKRGSNAQFVIVGHGALENDLRNAIIHKGMESYCRVLADPQRAKEYLHIAQIFLSPSLREGQPIVILEAMAAGVPVVAYANDGAKSVIADTINGLLVPIGNTNAAADAVEQLLTHPAQGKILAQAAYTHVESYGTKHSIRLLEEHIMEHYGS